MPLRRWCVALVVILAGCASVPHAPTPLAPWYPALNAHGDPVCAVFESRIPCADCEKIKVALALYQNRVTKVPTTYQLARVYVAHSPEDRLVQEGMWTITHGMPLDPHAVVYQLDANVPQEFQAYWAIGQDILFLLDQARQPRVGTAGYGYAFNKTHPDPAGPHVLSCHTLPGAF